MNHDNKIVRCANCGLRFMLTEEDTKCRFCKTESVEKVEIVENLPAQAGENKEPKKKMVK